MNHQQIREELSRAEATLQQHTAHIEKLRKMLETQEGCWKPEKDEVYYYLQSHGVISSTTNAVVFDQMAISIGNCFPTKEAAELHVKRLKAIQKLRELAQGWKPEWRTEQSKNWILAHNHSSGKWETVNMYFSQDIFQVYFETEAQAQAAITTLGDELNVLLD